MVEGRGRFVSNEADPAAVLTFCRSRRAGVPFRLTNLDDVRRRAGVLAVVAAADLDVDGRALGNAAFPLAYCPRPLAADDARYVGEPLAAVLAETEYAAADAAGALAVEYGPATPLAPPERALRAASGAALVVEMRHGSVPPAGPSTSLDLLLPRVAALPVEGRACTAEFRDDRLTVRASTQNPHRLRQVLAAALGLPVDRVRILVGDVGGAFGSKGMVYPEDVVVAWAATVTGRRVRWTESRRENLACSAHGRSVLLRPRLRTSAAGTMTAYELDMVQDAGAFAMDGAALPRITWQVLTGPYRVAASRFRSRSVATSGAPTGPVRGAGKATAAYALERVIDRTARASGVDPLELRLRNLRGDGPAARSARRTVHEALRLLDYAGLRRQQRDALAGGRYEGIGIAVCRDASGGPAARDEGRLRLTPGGELVVTLFGADAGQGHEDVAGRLLGPLLGIRVAAVRADGCDTDVAGAGGGSVASRTAAGLARVLAPAARELVAEVTHRLSGSVGGDIGFRPGFGFTADGRPLSWAEVEQLVGRVDAYGRSEGRAVAEHGSAHVARVLVDPETGWTTVLDYLAVVDAGRVVDRVGASGQVVGGIYLGISHALVEAVRYAPDSGQLLSADLAGYPVLGPDAVPPVRVHLLEDGSAPGGLGEVGTIGALPATVNAVVDALAPLGVTDVPVPATPEAVWRAIRSAGSRR